MKKLFLILFLFPILAIGQHHMMYTLAGQEQEEKDATKIVVVPYNTTGDIWITTDLGNTWDSYTSVGSINSQFSVAVDENLIGVQRLGSSSSYGEYSSTSIPNFSQTIIAANYPSGVMTGYNGQTLVLHWGSNSTYVSTITRNGGNTWTNITHSSIGSANSYGYGVSYSGDTLYVGFNATSGVKRSINGGSTWSSVTTPGNNTYCICCSANGHYVFQGQKSINANEVYVSSNAGSSWTGHDLIPSTAATSVRISCSYTGQYVLAHTNGKTFISSDYGSTWTEVLTSTTTEYISWEKVVSPSGKYMVMGDSGANGTYHLSINYGVNWTTKTINSFPSTTIRGISIDD